jgi:hypothetical protein
MRLVKLRATTLSDDAVSCIHQLVLKAEKRDAAGLFADCKVNLARLDTGQGKGKRNTSLNRGPTKIGINLPHAHIRTLAPTLFFREPTVRAFPLNPNQEVSAVAWEALINAYLARSGYVELTKEVVLASTIFSEVWKKWIYVKGDSQTDTQKRVNLRESGGGLTEHNYIGSMPWGEGDTIVGIPIMPMDVITDATNRRIEDSRFIAIKYTKLLSELKEDPRYSKGAEHFRNLELKLASRNMTQAASLGVDVPFTLTDKEDTINIYEVWIYQLVEFKLYKQIVVITDEGVLIRELLTWEDVCGDNWYGGYPFNKLELNPIPDSIGKSELATWSDLQNSLEWLLSKLITQVDRRKIVYKYNTEVAKNPTKALNQLHSGNPVEYIECNDSDRPLLETTPQAPASSDEWNFVSVLQALIQQVTGVGQNRRGGAGVRTATEASIIEQAARVKEDDKVSQVASFILRDIKILIGLMRSFVDRDFVFRLSGKIGGVKWGQFSRDDAIWSPDVEVEVESFRASVSQERMQAYAQALTLGSQLAPIIGNTVRLDKLYARLLEELKIPNPGEIVNGDSSAEIKQMTEIILIILGAPAPVLPTDNHLVEKQTIEAFVASEIYAKLPPAAQMGIAEHYEQHEAAMQQQGGTGTVKTGNSFEDTIRNGNPASEARQDTQGERTPEIGGNF